MGGPNLEIFKFSLYLLFPMAAIVHVGDPDWHKKHVVPYRDKLFPPDERIPKHMPTDQNNIREELNRIKQERLARKTKEVEESK